MSGTTTQRRRGDGSSAEPPSATSITNAASTIRSPWARLTSRMMPKISDSPVANRANRARRAGCLAAACRPSRASVTVRNRRRGSASRVRSLRPAGQRHPSLLETIDAIGDRHRLDDVLLDQDHAGALRLDVRQRGVDVADDDGREAEAELVAQEDTRVGHQARPIGDHLLLPAGQCRRRRVAPLPQHGKQLVDRGERPRPVACAGRRRRSGGSPRRSARERAAGLPAPGRCRA